MIITHEHKAVISPVTAETLSQADKIEQAIKEQGLAIKRKESTTAIMMIWTEVAVIRGGTENDIR